MAPQLKLFLAPGESREPTSGLSPHMTLRQFFEAHCVPKFHSAKEDEKVEGAREDTRDEYRTTLDKWERLTPNPPLSKITDQLCEEFLEKVKAEPGRRGDRLAAHTLRKHATNLKTMLRRAGPKSDHKKSGKHHAELLARVPLVFHSDVDDEELATPEKPYLTMQERARRIVALQGARLHVAHVASLFLILPRIRRVGGSSVSLLLGRPRLRASGSSLRLRDPSQDRRMAETIEREIALQNELRQLAAQRTELIVKAPRSGTLFATPNWKSAGEKPTEELAERPGTIFDPANAGLSIEKGELICLVGDAARREAQVLVDQTDVERVAAGQSATLLLYGRMDDWLESAVANVSPADADRISTRLTTASGGDLAATPTADGGSKPSLPAYEVRVPLDEATGAIGVGIRGRARILAGYASPGQRLMRFLAQTFYFAR